MCASLSTVLEVNPAILHRRAIRANLTLTDSMVASLTSQHVLLGAANCYGCLMWSCSFIKKSLTSFGKGCGVPVPSPWWRLVSANFRPLACNYHMYYYCMVDSDQWIDGMHFCGKSSRQIMKNDLFWLSKWISWVYRFKAEIGTRMCSYLLHVERDDRDLFLSLC